MTEEAGEVDDGALFTLDVGGTRLAVPVSHVVAVVEEQTPTKIPNVGAHMLGLVNFQGHRALLLLDLAKLTGLGAYEAQDRGAQTVLRRIVVLSDGDVEFGVPCRTAGITHRVDTVVLETSVLQGEALRRFVCEEIEDDRGIVGVLDFEAVVEEIRVGAA